MRAQLNGTGVMTVSRAPAIAIALAWRMLAVRLLACALLSTLAACAQGISTTNVAPTSVAAPSAPAAPATTAASGPAPAAPGPAAQPAEPPPKLTATEINEKCWMDPTINKVPDLDKRLKLVDKCVEQKTKAQGGL